MSLSEQAQRVLQEIERSLLADDPKFGSMGRSSGFGGDSDSRGSFNLRGIALIVVGLVVMVGGVALAQHSLWFVILSILGFLIMFGVGIWMLRGGGSSAGRGGAGGFSLGDAKSARPRNENSRAARLEDNFRRRFEER